MALFSAGTSDNAMEVLERVRQAVERHSFPQVGQVTISAGLSHADPNDLPQEVLSWADRALYQAKRMGRNRVCEYQTLLASGALEVPGYGGSELF